MSQLQTQFIALCGEYNFLTDPSAGAIGTVSLGVRVPRLCQVHNFIITSLIPPTSAGIATLSFGWNTRDVAPPLASPAAYYPVAVIATFGVPFGSVTNPGLLTAPERATNDLEVTMSIGAFPLTSGRLMFTFWMTVQTF